MDQGLYAIDSGTPAYKIDAHTYNADVDRKPFVLNNFGKITHMVSSLSNAWRRATDIPGVYIFRDDKKCLYVGSSKNSMKQRVVQHIRYGDGTKISVALEKRDLHEITVEFYPCDPVAARLEEMEAIVKWRPVYNSGIPI